MLAASRYNGMENVALDRWGRCPLCDQDTHQRLHLLGGTDGWADYQCTECTQVVRTWSPPRVVREILQRGPALARV